MRTASAGAMMLDVARRTDRDGGRRALQWTLGILAVIPFASGLAAMVLGTRPLPGDSTEVSATLDSEYRFANAFWFATAPVVWSTIPRIEEETTRLQVAAGVIFLGGLARLLSWRTHGPPHPAFVGATALELVGMPLVVAWQHRVAAPT